MDRNIEHLSAEEEDAPKKKPRRKRGKYKKREEMSDEEWAEAMERIREYQKNVSEDTK